MNLAEHLFAPALQFLAALGTLVALGWAVRGAPWQRLAGAGRLHAMLGAAVGLMLLWSMQAPVKPGLSLHLLGAMAVTLAFGPKLALVVLAIALTGIGLNGSIAWSAWPINYLLMALWPVLFAEAYRRAVDRFLPRHFFVYIFLVAFLGSGLTVMAAGATVSLLLWLSGSHTGHFLAQEFLPYFMLLGFSEAWLSGAALTLLVVFRPQWVASFDDRRYLINK